MARQIREPRTEAVHVVLLSGHTTKLLSKHLHLDPNTWVTFTLYRRGLLSQSVQTVAGQGAGNTRLWCLSLSKTSLSTSSPTTHQGSGNIGKEKEEGRESQRMAKNGVKF